MTCQSSLSGEPQPLTTSRSEKTTALDILLGPEEASQGFLTCTNEFDTYLAEKPVARKTQCLKWWKENSFRFPRLAEVTKSLLCIPATSAPAERLFSNAGLTVNRLRSSLNPYTVNTLVFLNKNHSFLNKY